MNIQCKRVYDPAEQNDGYRGSGRQTVATGVKKTDLACDEWNKALTPSTELRKAFHAELIDFKHFAELYRAELAQQQQEGKRLADIARQQTVTLLYAAKIRNKTTLSCWPSGYVNGSRLSLRFSRVISAPKRPFVDHFSTGELAVRTYPLRRLYRNQRTSFCWQ